MASKKKENTTSTQPAKVERPKSRKIPKEDPVAQPIPLVKPAPIEPVSKPVKPPRKGRFEKGSIEAREWHAQMKAAKESKKVKS